ncbi:MAG TPA: methyltransferase domain-containing protein [Candidatus Acidoferrum sp.]|nr:methyltransferase domain-containing protein [Candidatus Acidoferrum sp.]
MNTLLHVGCGNARIQHTTAGFNDGTWRELRVDINPAVKPDVLGSMLDMSSVADASVNAVYSSHSIEHLYPHEVPQALAEFLRVLKHDGFAVFTCPDLQSICQLVAEDKLLEPAYEVPAGKITPLDMLYGFRRDLALGNVWMAHHSGFTRSSLTAILKENGFGSVLVMARNFAPHYDLWAIAGKSARDDADMLELMSKHFP